MIIHAILFDMDGTLIDTEPSAVRVLERCFGDWGIQLSPEDSSYVAGRTWDSALDYLFNKYPLANRQLESRQQILDQYREQIEQNLLIVPGAVQAVQLFSKAYPLALVSGSRRKDIEWVLSKLKIRDCFKIVKGAEDYPRSKPAPDGYLVAAQELKTDPSQCLVFEDSAAGIASAQSAGMKVVAVTSTNHFAQDLSSVQNQISDFNGITLKWIEQLIID